MADSSPLAVLLDRASTVFELAYTLGWDLQQEHREQDLVSMVGQESPRERRRETINEFIAATLDMRDVIEAPPEGFETVADQLRNAGQLARNLPQLNGWDILDQWPDLNKIAHDGYQAVKEVREGNRLNDPWAFLDEPPDIEQRIADGDSVEAEANPPALAADNQERSATVNDRMKAELAANLEDAKGRTAQQWADKLGCGKSTVIESETWKSLSLLRQQAQVELRNDRRRK